MSEFERVAVMGTRLPSIKTKAATTPRVRLRAALCRIVVRWKRMLARSVQTGLHLG